MWLEAKYGRGITRPPKDSLDLGRGVTKVLTYI